MTWLDCSKQSINLLLILLLGEYTPFVWNLRYQTSIGGRTCMHYLWYIHGLVQERRNSIADGLELRLSCFSPSYCEDGLHCSVALVVQKITIKLWCFLCVPNHLFNQYVDKPSVKLVASALPKIDCYIYIDWKKLMYSFCHKITILRWLDDVSWQIFVTD